MWVLIQGRNMPDSIKTVKREVRIVVRDRRGQIRRQDREWESRVLNVALAIWENRGVAPRNWNLEDVLWFRDYCRKRYSPTVSRYHKRRYVRIIASYYGLWPEFARHLEHGWTDAKQ